ncbi:cell division transport system ATP-binding protein [Desulfonauticus submarinus]|uniref:Cell division ATP-binding protein FtsE n=1 Tax=Desulfonauticus submarinus TaxID=206665 RepID=A0A1H0BV06_9BACT|nr:cell division ATP-binding protein FtsE [Desulfonauticus submarinus]SDN49472.1 cell division transport system ATP-binding protein [Desulfonauticus submarinus]
MIHLKNVSYSFGRNWALKNISFDLEKGDFLFITGPSGAGKTTLLKLLHADLFPKGGEIKVAGYDLKKLPTRKHYLLKREVSIVLQDFKILTKLTVFENVALPLVVQKKPTLQIQKRVRAVLRSIGLYNKASVRCDELSGGEQQRVAIARAMVVNPKILLADEPTGNLDKTLSLHLLSVFNQFNLHGTTIVMATHNEELVSRQDRAKILYLQEGNIEAKNF